MVVTELRILLVDTARVWWRLLPQIMTLYLLGWLTTELTLRIAVILGDVSPWFTLVLFAVSFVFTLVAAVLILRLAGRELGVVALLPSEEAEHDDREQGVSQLLVVTLLPFLGMYAAFGQVSKVASRLEAEQIVRYGYVTDQSTVFSVLNGLATRHVGWLLALILGVYLLRRIADAGYERTGWRPLGLVTVFIEAFFILMLLVGGIRVFQRLRLWLGDRVVAQWLDTAKAEISSFFAIFAIDLPAVFVRIGHLFSEQIWPVLTEVVGQPLLWLAVAALVFGSRVLSLAELWRQGQTYARRLPGADVFARYRERRALRRIGPAPQGVRLVAGQLTEAFFGDVNDKYLPTLHSLRLVLRAGPVFLGCFVFSYSIVLIVQNDLARLVHWLIGGHAFTFWVQWGPWIDVLETAPVETLRLCLLAVAFRRCLELFRRRSSAAVVSPDHDVAVAVA